MQRLATAFLVSLAVVLAVPLLSCGGGGGGSTAPAVISIDPADATGLRSFDGGTTVLLLTFLAVKSGTEDRSILHFSTGGLPVTFSSARLDCPIDNIDPGPPGGTLDFYSWTGDGVVSIDEWDYGSLLAAYTGIGGGTQVISTDITAQLQSAIAASRPFLSFNVRGGSGTDRYWLGSTTGLPLPTITITP